MGTPNDPPFDAIYFEDADLVHHSERSRPRPESNELAVHVAELASQIAELTEAIHVLASRTAPVPIAEPRRMPEPVRAVHEPESLPVERTPRPHVRPVDLAPEMPARELPVRSRFDHEEWPSDAELSQFSRRQEGRDDGVW